MFKFERSGLCVALTLLLVGLAPRPAAAQDDARAAIDAANKALSAALAKGQVAEIANMYSADGQMMPPNADVVKGREAIRNAWQGMVDAGTKSLKLTAVEVVAHGDMAHEVGTYEEAGADGKTMDRGKYIVIWKREQGQWKLHRDIWNSNMPAAAPR